MTGAAVAGWALALVATLAAVTGAGRLGRARRLAARASHEVRGPLAAAHLALDALRRDGTAAPEAVLALEAQLRRAALALDDLVVAASGRRAPDRLEPVAVGALVAQLAATWAPVADAAGRRLVVAEAGEVGGALLLADPTRLAQAAGNLVANALEHGSGPVELRARAVAGRLRLEVRDGGPGLPAPVAALAGTPRGIRGHGLAIAGDIAGRHGGRLTAAPSPGGAALVLELPLLSAGPGAGTAEEGRP